MKKIYKTESYKDPTLLLSCIIILLLILIGVSIYIGKIYSSKLLSLWFPMLLLIFPFIFSKTIKNKFIKNGAILEFDDLAFSITLYSLNTNDIISQERFLWHNVEGFKFYFDTKKNTSLTLYLRDERKRTYIFKDDKSFEEAIKENSVFSNFYYTVKEYNRSGVEILPKCSLLASKFGKIIILVESGFILGVFLLHLINHSLSKSYYLILAIGFLIPQIVNRSQNKSVYEKIKNLN